MAGGGPASDGGRQRGGAAAVRELLLWLFRAAAAGSEGAPTRWRGGPADVATLTAALDLHRGWTLLARRHHLVGGLPDDVVQRALTVRRRAAGHQLAVETDLATCGRALDAAGVPWVCVKGPVLDALYRRTGDSRSSTDLDLLVGPGDFTASLQALGGAGTALINRNWTLLRSALPGEVALRAPVGTTVDLHWSLVHKSARRGRAGLVTEELLATASSAQVGQLEVPVLEPARALAHLCLHAAGSGGARLYWLLDTALQARDPGLEWGSLVSVARQWRVEVAVGLVLDRARRRLRAPVPRDVVRELLGRRGWAGVDRAAGLLGGGRADVEERASRQVCTGALEHGSLPGWVLVRGVRRPGAARHRRPFVQGPDDPGSALYRSGTQEDLAAYLAAVGREAAGEVAREVTP